MSIATRNPPQDPAAGQALAVADSASAGSAELGIEPSAECKAQIEAQVEAFMASLASADPNGEEFRRSLDAAFRLGRKEIAEATRLSTAFMRENFRASTDGPAYQAMARLR